MALWHLHASKIYPATNETQQYMILMVFCSQIGIFVASVESHVYRLSL